MNLDFLSGKWLQPSYRLCSLTRKVQDICNTNNFSQLVSQPTRYMYNSVTNSTEISCIDHVYCNSKLKCSTPSIIPSGASDHDIVSYVRYTKAPPTPARTIRRRSYTSFNEQDFLSDLSKVDWTQVYVETEVDNATEIFTKKFIEVLNFHAPWIIYQKRKNFCPWLTEETKTLMELRDSWKDKCEQLANSSPNSICHQEAWSTFKKYRNKINNRNKFEEINYKKRDNFYRPQ